MAVMDIIIRAQDEASSVIHGIGEAGSEAASFFEENWLAISAGAAVAGTAIEGFNRSQQDTTVAIQQGALATGMSEGAYRNLATEVSNVTFPIEDVLDLMESGRRQGIQGAEGLAEYAHFWDMVGDATGESATMLGDAGVALRALGISAGNESEALDAFGYITENTTSSVGDFLTFLERSGPELREMGMDVNDAAAIMGVLENEMGMTGRTARTEFRQAVSSADGSLEEMLETLGVSEEQLGRHRTAVDGSGQTIEDFADIYADSFTPLQRFQHMLKEQATLFAPVVQGASALGPALMVIGPAMRGAQMASTALAGGFRVLGAAILANPIFLVAAAIIAIGAAIWIFRDEIMAALGAAWDWIRDSTESILEFITDAWDGLVEWVSNIPENLLEALEGLATILFDFIVEWHPLAVLLRLAAEYLPGLLEWLRGLPGEIIGALSDLAGAVIRFSVENHPIAVLLRVAGERLPGILSWFRELPGKIVDALASLAGDLSQVAVRALGQVAGFIGGLVTQLPHILSWMRGLPGKIMEAIGSLAGNLRDIGINAAKALFDGMVSILSMPGDYIGAAVSGVTNFIGGLKGPPEHDFWIGENAATQVMLGLVKGFNQHEMLRDPLTSLTGVIEDMIKPSPSARPAMAGVGASRSSGSSHSQQTPSWKVEIGQIVGVQADDVSRAVRRAITQETEAWWRG